MRNARFVELQQEQCFVVSWWENNEIHEREFYGWPLCNEFIQELDEDGEIDSGSITLSVFEELFWESE